MVLAKDSQPAVRVWLEAHRRSAFLDRVKPRSSNLPTDLEGYLVTYGVGRATHRTDPSVEL